MCTVKSCNLYLFETKYTKTDYSFFFKILIELNGIIAKYFKQEININWFIRSRSEYTAHSSKPLTFNRPRPYILIIPIVVHCFCL